MTLLAAARKVRKLGLLGDIRRIVGARHVGEPRIEIENEVRRRVHRAFVWVDKLGPDAIAWGPDVCADACARYAVAIHRHNLRTYGRVVGGRI